MMKAFVIMSFSQKFDDIYNLGIKISCNNYNIEAIRLDEQIFDEGMLERIYQDIQKSDLIIAELSDKKSKCLL